LKFYILYLSLYTSIGINKRYKTGPLFAKNRKSTNIQIRLYMEIKPI